ncbi:Broad substrate specificity ATP-binding cassette transporter ABCG2 [Labeo rohita]|uniref:Broad substrate specificity ATP-binding cassette transporter ABCG2 n=1 Tax=Labeo rohita TaxID=84645 RepID=A0ABQ8N0Z1_LABRO|nr:Broad substrate specificity ATP-binding cassette transporter ABCG2 [Labeo rohita]
MLPVGENYDTQVFVKVPGPTLTYQNIHYCVRESRGLCRKRGPEREILKNVSGIMKTGLNAIMGATGSGKTSLLDVIAGRKDPRGLRSGQVLVDNNVVTSNLRLMSAYVVQDDILMGTLTVRENLLFSGNLRLPRKQYSTADKEKKVESIIQELGLEDCAHTKIGTEFIRGVSGGERKRCSIGMELITSPTLLFLDEPTTGLDSNTANSIIALLHKLSRGGRTIIFSIHQPRYSIFRLFDHLTLLHKGETVYAGPAGKAMDYFQSLAEPPEVSSVINVRLSTTLQISFLDITNGEISSSMPTEKSLAELYKESQYCAAVKEELKSITGSPHPSSKANSKAASYATSFFYQLKVVCWRTVLNVVRNPQTSYAQIAMNILFALLIGLIYYQMPLTLPEALQNRIGAFFFLIINMVFGNLSAVELFINERAIFVHENSGGYYRTSVYFLSKVFVDLIPNRIVPILIFSSISYYMMGLNPSFTSFLCFALTMSMVSLAGVSLAFLVSASVSSFAMANVLITLPFVFMMVFGGFLVNLNSMLNWLSWLKWASIFKYGLDAVTINEMKGQVFYNGNATLTGEMYLQSQGIDYSVWGFWQNQVALLGIILCSLLEFHSEPQCQCEKSWKASKVEVERIQKRIVKEQRQIKWRKTKRR